MDNDLKKQIDAAMAHSLNLSGIGKALHKIKLSDYGAGGKALETLALDTLAFRKYIRAGNGYSLDCTSHKTANVAFALGRAMRLNKIDVRVLDVFDLLNYLDEPAADYARTKLDDFEWAQAIILFRMYTPELTPYKDRDKWSYLEYYLSRRLRAGLSVSVQYEGALESQRVWSKFFIDELADKNQRVKI